MVNFGCEKWLLNKKGFSRLAPGAFRYCLGRELFHYAICISLDLPNVIHLVLDLQLSLKTLGDKLRLDVLNIHSSSFSFLLFPSLHLHRGSLERF